MKILGIKNENLHNGNNRKSERVRERVKKLTLQLLSYIITPIHEISQYHSFFYSELFV